MNRHSTLLIAALLLSACARTEPADETPGEDLNVAAPAQEAAAEEAAAPGTWEASAQGQAQGVTFRGPQGDLLFTINCDLRGGLVVQRPGLVARGNLALMQLRTADVVRRFAVNAASGAQPQVEARIPYNDPLIQALVAFDVPLEVRYEGVETLILPPSPLVGDLVRTCQQVSDTAISDQANQAAPAENAAQPEPAANRQ